MTCTCTLSGVISTLIGPSESGNDELSSSIVKLFYTRHEQH